MSKEEGGKFMKKLLFLSVCLVALPVMAQKSNECALTPLQDLIVNARSANEVRELIARGKVFDEPVRCGGTITQLAIRRGNPDVLKAILEQDPNRAKAVVSLDAFPILGAPKQIPIILFAAYYAPNRQMVDLLTSAQADISVTDDFGRNLLWYLNKNPVLRNTDLQDELNKELLFGLNSSSNQSGQQTEGAANAVQEARQEAPANAIPADRLVQEN